jgi:hypothetical protein
MKHTNERLENMICVYLDSKNLFLVNSPDDNSVYFFEQKDSVFSEIYFSSTMFIVSDTMVESICKLFSIDRSICEDSISKWVGQKTNTNSNDILAITMPYKCLPKSKNFNSKYIKITRKRSLKFRLKRFFKKMLSF